MFPKIEATYLTSLITNNFQKDSTPPSWSDGRHNKCWKRNIDNFVGTVITKREGKTRNRESLPGREKLFFLLKIIQTCFGPHPTLFNSYLCTLLTAGEWKWPFTHMQYWQNCHLNVPIFFKSGNVNLLETSGPVQSCASIAMHMPFTYT
jgi:hypothetical protein